MRETVIPPGPGNGSHKTKARGLAILNSPLLNKGTAFTTEERDAFGLHGLLPADISTLVIQVKRAYLRYERLPDTASKHLYLSALQDRNEVLFYRLLSEHLCEMVPVVASPTSGTVTEKYQPECRHPRTVYLSIDSPEAIRAAFANVGAGPDDIDLVIATDAEEIAGAGDCGVGGVESCVSKLTIYTAAGGVDPARVIPVMLDTGTNRESLLEDPTYIGNCHARVRGERYEAFIQAYVSAVTACFPHAVLQWEGFALGNARRILEKYRKITRTFNEDLQGIGAMALAAAISAVRVCGTPLRGQRVVVFGTGAAGFSSADLLCDAMMRDGLSAREAARRFWCLDEQQLLTTEKSPHLQDHQRKYARPASESIHWKNDGPLTGIGLAEVVRRVKPTLLIGASMLYGSFTEAIVREMASHTERPAIFVLSSSPARAEATPADLIAWTGGRALVATGSQHAPVTYKGLTYGIGYLNNAMMYPGLVLGTIVSRAARITDSMLAAAANAISSLVTIRQPGAPLLPHIDDLRSVAATVAVAVAHAADAEGLSRTRPGDLVQQVHDAMWQPEYRRLQAC
jgi:malate dehydrogenase (oxaloacetate-decarboxylating)